MLAARGLLIARHQAIYAATRTSESRRQATEDELLGADALQGWVITGDDRLCDTCAPLEGLTAKLDEPLAPGIYQPGDVRTRSAGAPSSCGRGA